MTQPLPPIATLSRAPATPVLPARQAGAQESCPQGAGDRDVCGQDFRRFVPISAKVCAQDRRDATNLLSSDPVPMDFVQPGGVAVAAVTFRSLCIPTAIWLRRFSTLA